MRKIVFTGGGTLGHIYPMIPVIKEIKKECKEDYIYFIGTQNGLEKNLIPKIKEVDEAYYLDMIGLYRKFTFRNIKTIIKYFKCKKQLKKILRKIKPDIIVGMGGYISGVVIRTAQILKIKTVIHEQNSVLGLSNKITLKKANKILLSYKIEELENNNKVKIVGNPRTTEFYNKYKNKKPQEDNTIVVVGGSRGATKINDIILSLIEDFKNNNVKVILITGNKYFKENNLLLNRIKSPSFKIISFASNLSEYLFNASLIITRSGATTLSEIIGLKKISLLIPSPNVTGNHQEKNAQVLVCSNAARMILEDELTKEKLFEEIKNLLNNKELRNEIKTNLKNIGIINSCQLFYKEIIDLCDNNG